MTCKGESIFKRLEPIYFSPQNLLVSSKFSHGLLLLFSFQVPLMILLELCEDKGNIPSVQISWRCTLSEAERTFPLSLYHLPKPDMEVRYSVNDLYMTVFRLQNSPYFCSLLHRGLFVLWGGFCVVGRLGRKKKRSSPARFLFFRLLIFWWGYPAGASAEERGIFAYASTRE